MDERLGLDVGARATTRQGELIAPPGIGRSRQAGPAMSSLAGLVRLRSCSRRAGGVR